MIAALVLFGVWFALTREAEPLSLAVAAVAIGTALAARHWILPRTASLGSALLRRPHRAVAFVAFLFWQVVRSTAYTCRVILFHREESRMVVLPTALRTPLSQFLLSHAITLTPSTISLLFEGDLLYVHWLGIRGRSGDVMGIAEPFERRLLLMMERENDGRR